MPPSAAAPRPRVPLVRLVAVAALGASAADAVPPRTVDSGSWYQLSYPAEVGARPLRALFGASLPPAGYGETWQVYAFDADAQVYVDPGIDGTLAEGAGFWFVQATGGAVDLGTADVPFAVGIASPACAVLEGCRESTLSGADDGADWNLAGHPFEAPVTVADVRLVTGAAGSACAAGGCSLGASVPEVLARSRLWSWDPDAGEYLDLSGGTIAPWTGFWIGLAPGAGRARPSLLHPDPFCS